VVSTASFSANQLIAVGSKRGAFQLGFATGADIVEIQSVDDATTLTLKNDLAGSYLVGAMVTGVEFGRVTAASATSGAGTVTLAEALSLGSSDGSVTVNVREKIKLGDIISSVFHFTGGLKVGAGAGDGVFKQFIPGPGAADDLLVLQQGLAYWMIVKDGATKRIADPVFLDGIEVPAAMLLDNAMFSDPTGNPPRLPATRGLANIGWHMLALIGESDQPVEKALRGMVEEGNFQYTSVVGFEKFVNYTPDDREVHGSEATLEIVGGAFKPLFAGNTSSPGDIVKITRGLFVFTTVANTVHTP
jgi:hypothetical protein